MDPILSPWLIYLLWILTGLEVASLFVLCLSIFVGIFGITYGFIEEADWTKKFLKWCAITFVISGVVYLLIPPKEYLVAMVVTSYVTPENMHALNEMVKSTLGEYISVIKDGI